MLINVFLSYPLNLPRIYSVSLRTYAVELCVSFFIGLVDTSDTVDTSVPEVVVIHGSNSPIIFPVGGLNGPQGE